MRERACATIRDDLLPEDTCSPSTPTVPLSCWVLSETREGGEDKGMKMKMFQSVKRKPGPSSSSFLLLLLLSLTKFRHVEERPGQRLFTWEGLSDNSDAVQQVQLMSISS